MTCLLLIAVCSYQFYTIENILVNVGGGSVNNQSDDTTIKKVHSKDSMKINSINLKVKRCSWCSQEFTGKHYMHYRRKQYSDFQAVEFTHCHLSNNDKIEDWRYGIFCSHRCCAYSKKTVMLVDKSGY